MTVLNVMAHDGLAIQRKVVTPATTTRGRLSVNMSADLFQRKKATIVSQDAAKLMHFCNFLGLCEVFQE